MPSRINPFGSGNLINLLFEYVKLDSEGFTLNCKTLDLCELLRENAAMLYAEMEENGMTLTADIPEETIPVWADIKKQLLWMNHPQMPIWDFLIRMHIIMIWIRTLTLCPRTWTVEQN